MIIKYVTFEITSRCNMNCRFCFSNWRDGEKEMSTDKVKRIISKLKHLGLEAINFTGGDPLLRSDLEEILRYCKELSLTTIISTNGILIQNYKEILNYLDFINLPLDSINKEIHNEMRPCFMENHHGYILDLINEINKKYSNIKIKINTMVSKKNIETILLLGEKLKNKIATWKLSQFLDGGFGKAHKEEFDISFADYIKLVKKCINKYKEINIIGLPAKKKDDYCLIISPNGHLLKPNNNNLIDLGKIENILEIKDFSIKRNTKYYDNAYKKED